MNDNERHEVIEAIEKALGPRRYSFSLAVSYRDGQTVVVTNCIQRALAFRLLEEGLA